MTIKGKIGCEIECIVSSRKIQPLTNYCRTKNWEVGSDGSIRTSNYNRGRGVEFKAGIYPVKDREVLVGNLKEAFKFIKVNSSCGLHIHLSFENWADYYKLLNWKFVDDFQNVIRKKFKTEEEQKRLNNNYCKLYPNEEVFKEEVETQLKHLTKDGSRYRCINFNSCNIYKTIEFRIFPATKSIKTFEKYLNLLLKIVEKHLEGTKLEPISLEVKYKVKRNPDEPVIIREIITKEEKEQIRKDRETITLEPAREDTN